MLVCWRLVLGPVVIVVSVDMVRCYLKRVCERFVTKETNLFCQQIHNEVFQFSEPLISESHRKSASRPYWLHDARVNPPTYTVKYDRDCGEVNFLHFGLVDASVKVNCDRQSD